MTFSGTEVESLHTWESGFVIRFIFFIYCIAIIYFNMYVLVPKLLFKDKYWLYFASIIIFLSVTFLILIPGESAIDKYRIQSIREESPSIWVTYIMFILNLGILIAASTTIKLMQRWLIDGQRINDLEKLTMKVELEQLKNQINPHFLFNMLNSINVLILKDPKKASHILMVLSDLLRYQLYDTSRTKVLLNADINFITDFLNLEKIRRDNFSFNVAANGETDSVLIAPLLFIPFVENATKHNDYGEKQSYVDIKFSLIDNVLHFYCENSKAKDSKTQKEKGGLGLSNIKRRLELLYPDAHELSISDNETNYIVNLYIRL